MFWTWCASRILTSKCASRHNSVHFFRHRNFRKRSENGVLCTFWHLNVLLRAATACNFSSPIWPHGSAPAALANLLFDHLEPQITGKTHWIAAFLPFRAPASSFFSLFLFSDLLASFLLLSDSSHLCFLCNIVGSLTSKLLSISIHTIYIYI